MKRNLEERDNRTSVFYFVVKNTIFLELFNYEWFMNTQFKLKIQFF